MCGVAPGCGHGRLHALVGGDGTGLERLHRVDAVGVPTDEGEAGVGGAGDDDDRLALRGAGAGHGTLHRIELAMVVDAVDLREIGVVAARAINDDRVILPGIPERAHDACELHRAAVAQLGVGKLLAVVLVAVG